jgi:hypothetical protein
LRAAPDEKSKEEHQREQERFHRQSI